jgi:hypothetical protein
MYVVSFSTNSFLVWTRAAFRRFDRSANDGLVNVAIDDSRTGTGQRMSQEASEGKAGG